MDPIWLVIGLVGGVMFLALAVPIALLLNVLPSRPRYRPEPESKAPPTSAPTDLAHDAELLDFFSKIDPNFKREFPSLQRTSAEQVQAASADDGMVAMERLWPRLSHNDRREIIMLAEMKVRLYDK